MSTVPPLMMFICLLLSSCSTDLPRNQNSRSSASSSSQAIKQKFLFEKRYVNFAWSYQYAGIYIDGNGGIYSYAYRQGDKPHISPSGNLYTEQELEDKYNHNKKRIGEIKLEILAEKFKLIESASKGGYSEPISRGADQGTNSVVCYTYDAATGRYREVTLITKGDMNYENLSESARVLTKWLESLNLSEVSE